jgi:hypothetical protein
MTYVQLCNRELAHLFIDEFAKERYSGVLNKPTCAR